MSPKSSHLTLLVVLALAFTLLNSFKPVCIDDMNYLLRARQIAAAPLDPFGFQIYWNDRPEPSINVVAPPLLPYWWAPALKLFGERPLLWKLWLLPFSLLLVFSLHGLLARFAAGQELTFTILTVFSPLFLPSFNLMLEIPVTALGLAALLTFTRACDRTSYALAAAAGVVAALSMQTKYTALVVPCVLLLYAVIHGRALLGLVAASVAGLLFASVEALLVMRYGQSHFLASFGFYSAIGTWGLRQKLLYLGPALITLTGGLLPALALAGLAALRTRARTIFALASLVALGYLVVAFLPLRLAVLTRFAATGEPRFTVAHVVFAAFGLLTCAVVAVAAWRQLRLSKGAMRQLTRWRTHRVEWFLALWLLAELAAYFAVAPFPAVRRVFGLAVASTLLIARLASLTCRARERKTLMHAIAVFGVALGLMFYTIDFIDARAEKLAAEAAARRVRERDASADAWYVGRWGFQYYAERAGLKPLVPDTNERPRAGDLIVLNDGLHQPAPAFDIIDDYRLEPVESFEVGDSLPLTTMRVYYGGDLPIQRHEGPRRRVRLYRITAEHER